MFYRDYWTRPLTLNELLEEAENLETDEEGVPDEILIFPPENNELTDEDSGEEDDVLLQNLPRSQLIAHAVMRR